MDQPRWLDDTQQRAWRSLLVFVSRGLPEIERTFRAHDLLVVHYTIMVALSEAPGRTLGLSQLADRANTSRSRLTHRLRTLVDRGEVVIEPDPDDGRAKNAVLTDLGLARIRAVAPLHAEDAQRLFFDALDSGETRVLADTLGKVAANLCENGLGPGRTPAVEDR